MNQMFLINGAMILAIIVSLSVIILIATTVIVLQYRRILQLEDRAELNSVSLAEPDNLIRNISVRELLNLVNAGFSEDVELLMEESGVINKQPIFYGKYQELSKANREVYFQNLLEILSKNNPGFVDNLMNHYTGVSMQDILLLLLNETGLENKVIARVLFINAETLKKRKSRLKVKLKEAGFSFTDK